MDAEPRYDHRPWLPFVDGSRRCSLEGRELSTVAHTPNRIRNTGYIAVLFLREAIQSSLGRKTNAAMDGVADSVSVFLHSVYRCRGYGIRAGINPVLKMATKRPFRPHGGHRNGGSANEHCMVSVSACFAFDGDVGA